MTSSAVAAPPAGPDASLMSSLAQSFVEQSTFTRVEITDSTSTQAASRSERPITTVVPVTPNESPRRAAQRVSGTPQKKGNVFSWTNDMLAEQFHFIEEVGFGNWGSVWKVKRKGDQSGAVQSVKLVHRSDEPASAVRTRALWTEFECIRLMNTKPHPNIIRFYSHITTPTYSLCTMDFHSRLMPISLDETKSRPYFFQLLSAVAHLHANGITHSDLKPANILLSADDRPILIDFGFARYYDVTKSEAFLSSLSWGTPEYLSPERAKGAWHDERLSDVFALGVTMYEIVIGRTPFEQSEHEAFLNREALEVYYNRTLTGKFHGPFELSEPLQDLLVSMIQPDPRHRMPSCALAMRHRFFSPQSAGAQPQPQPVHARSPQGPSILAPPLHATRSVVQPTHDYPQASTPRRRTPKKVADVASFAIFEDVTKPDAPSTPTKSFTPRRLALTERTNRTPQSESRKVAPKPISLAKLAKSPPPSRIPVRKAEISSPLDQRVSHSLTARPTTSASRTTSTSHQLRGRPAPLPVRPRIVSQPVLSQMPIHQLVMDALQAVSNAGDGEQARSPKVGDIEGAAAPAQKGLQSQSPSIVGDHSRILYVAPASATEPFSTENASILSSADASDSSPGSEGSPDFVVRTRTYTVAHKMSKGGNDTLTGSFLSDIPKLTRSSSRVLSNGLKKLSSKHGRKSSEARSRRRMSLSDTTFKIIEAERFADRDAHTMPINFEQLPGHKATVARARLVSLTNRSQELIRPVLEADPFLIAPSAPGKALNSAKVSRAGGSAQPKPSPKRVPLEQTVAQPFLFGSVGLSTDRGKPGRDTGRSQASSGRHTQSTPDKTYRPGHRRIPTAIRNTPSVLVYESVDDGDCSVSDFSRCETPASPPPAPRIVAEARQLPTWIPAQSDSESDAEADVDEPTLKLGSPTSRTLVSISAQSLSQFSEEVESALAGPSDARPPVKQPPTTARPPSTFSALPFTNLHQRSDSASTFNTLASSKCEPSRLHKRSRSVLSFFSLLSPSPALDSTSSLATSRTGTSRPSESSYAESRDMGDADVTIKMTHVEPVSTKGKKGGKFRKAVKRLFK